MVFSTTRIDKGISFLLSEDRFVDFSSMRRIETSFFVVNSVLGKRTYLRMVILLYCKFVKKKALQQTPSTHRDNGAIAHLDDTFAHCLLTIAKDRSGHGSNVGHVDCAPFPLVQL